MRLCYSSWLNRPQNEVRENPLKKRLPKRDSALKPILLVPDARWDFSFAADAVLLQFCLLIVTTRRSTIKRCASPNGIWPHRSRLDTSRITWFTGKFQLHSCLKEEHVESPAWGHLRAGVWSHRHRDHAADVLPR